jgi:hypothetical protein
LSCRDSIVPPRGRNVRRRTSAAFENDDVPLLAPLLGCKRGGDRDGGDDGEENASDVFHEHLLRYSAAAGEVGMMLVPSVASFTIKGLMRISARAFPTSAGAKTPDSGSYREQYECHRRSEHNEIRRRWD